jgi:hypothetical protein
VSFAACAGAVLVSPDSGRCAEIVSRAPEQRGAEVRTTECRGGVKQRWRLRTTRGAIALEAVASGNCLDVAADGEGGAPTLRQTACTDSSSQRFIRRSGSKAMLTLESAVSPRQRWIAQRSTVH